MHHTIVVVNEQRVDLRIPPASFSGDYPLLGEKYRILLVVLLVVVVLILS